MKALKVLIIVLLASFSYSVASAQIHRKVYHKKHHVVIRHHHYRHHR